MKSSNGYALPGTITVIMSPAKSGKSTLLRALAGRLPHSTRMYGEVFYEWLKVAYAVWFIPGVVFLSSICPAHYLRKSYPSQSENATSTPSWFFRRPFPPPSPAKHIKAGLFPLNLQEMLMEIPRKAKDEITVRCQ
ncbi:hypothetical protein ACFX15_032141 [Malus domestica]